MPTTLTIVGFSASKTVAERAEIESRAAFSCGPARSPGVARKKASHGAGIEAYGRACTKVSEKIDGDEKNFAGMAAMQLLHCTMVTNQLCLACGGQIRGLGYGVLHRNVRAAASAGTAALSFGARAFERDEQRRPRRYRHQAGRLSAYRPRNVDTLIQG